MSYQDYPQRPNIFFLNRPLHSFIIDLEDSIIKKIFTNPELEEMANTNIKTDPVVDKVFVDELNRFSEITTIQGFCVALNKLSTKCLETSNKDDPTPKESYLLKKLSSPQPILKYGALGIVETNFSECFGIPEAP
ncbi:11644_t:CDS:2 [Entrophospora sp. SA101]|nr:11644_t:CDS:2 [Entrophospora sp. SA101]